MRQPRWKNLPIISMTSEARREIEEVGIYFFQLEDLLKRSFPCPRSKRRKEIHVRCVHRKGKVLKIVLQEKVAESGKRYWRVNHLGLIARRKRKV